MTPVTPLNWTVVGSDLIKSGAMGTTYTVFRHATGPWIAQADGLTVYTGEDIEAAKLAIQDRHTETVQALLATPAFPRTARFDDEGELDEFAAADIATLHLEQMDRGHWNLIVAHADGGETMIDLTTKRPRATRIGAMITTDYDGEDEQ